MASARAYREQATAPFDWDQEWLPTEESAIWNIEHGIRGTNRETSPILVGRKPRRGQDFAIAFGAHAPGLSHAWIGHFPMIRRIELVTQKQYHTADPRWLKPGATDQKRPQRLSARRGFRPTNMGKSTIQSESTPGNNLMSSARIAPKLTFSWASAVIRSTCRA